MSTIQDSLTHYITGQLIPSNGHDTLGPDDNLLLSGLVDSMGVMRLVAHMEKEYAIEIQPGEVTLKNFKTVNAMARFVEHKLGA